MPASPSAGRNRLARGDAMAWRWLLAAAVLGGLAPWLLRSVPVRIRVAGSTAFLPLVLRMVAAYRREHPGVEIDVTGGGSGFALAQLQRGVVDVGVSDLPRAAPRLVTRPWARTPVLMVVARRLGVTAIRRSAIRSLRGSSRPVWPGTRRPVIFVERPYGSGTQALVERWAGPLNPRLRPVILGANGLVAQVVAATAGATGFLDASDLRADLVPLRLDGVTPTLANVAAGRYPLVLTARILTRARPGGEVRRLVRALTSTRAVAAAGRPLGYLPP